MAAAAQGLPQGRVFHPGGDVPTTYAFVVEGLFYQHYSCSVLAALRRRTNSLVYIDHDRIRNSK